jgi:hypothetical protein
MRVHALVTILQSRVRGMQLRAWFRASLAAAGERVSDRSYFLRVCAIGQQLKHSESIDPAMARDKLARQARAAQAAVMVAVARALLRAHRAY